MRFFCLLRFVGYPSILKDHCYSHRTYSTRNRRDSRYTLLEWFKVNISNCTTIHKSASDINNHCFRSNHLLCNESNSSCCNNKYICSFGYFFEVSCSRITGCNGCSGIERNEIHRFSYYVWSTDDDNMFSFHWYFIGFEQFFDSFWSTRNKSVRISEKEISYIGSSESINILHRTDCFNDISIDEMRWKRGLDDNTVYIWIFIDFANLRENRCFICECRKTKEWKPDSNCFTGPFLHTNIALTCRIFSDKNHSKMRSCVGISYFFSDVFMDTCSNHASVEDHSE